SPGRRGAVPLPVQEERYEKKSRAFESYHVPPCRPADATLAARPHRECKESRCAPDGEPRFVRPMHVRSETAEASDRENDDDESGRNAFGRWPSSEPER